MPKLLQINSASAKGSTGGIAETIGRLATQRGWDCYIASSVRHSSPSQMKSIIVGSKFGTYLHAFFSMLFDAHGYGSIWSTRKLVRKIKRIKPDVIHLHNIHGYYLNYPILFNYLRESRTPVVWTFHDFWAITGHCAIVGKEICEKWKTGCGTCPLIRDYPKSYIDRSCSNYIKKKELFTSIENMTIVTVSDWLKSIVEQSFLNDKNIKTIPNGIDTSVFYPRYDAVKKVRENYKWGDKVVVLSVVDRWHEGVGFSDIWKLREKLDERFVIVLVGVTQKQKDILPEGVVGILHTSNRDELAELYTAADIGFPPQTVCTFGLVTAEAMACGTPSVVYAEAASEVIGIKELVVQTRNIDELASTIKSFMLSGGKQSYSEYCIKRANEVYDSINNYSKYVDLYETLITE